VPVKLNISLGAIAALQLLSSVALQLVVIAFVGAGPQTDALIAAQAVPQVLLAVLAISLQSAWQPRLAVLAHDGPAWRNAQGVAHGQVILLFWTSALVLAALAKWWIGLLFPGFTSEQRELAHSLTFPLLAGTVLTGHAALLTSAQRARDRFVTAETTALAGTVLAIGVVAVTVARFGVVAAAWTSLGRAALVCVALHAQAGRPKPLLADAWRCSRMWKQVRPMLAGSSIYKTAPLVDRFWTSQASAGGVTVFSLAQTAMGAVAAVLERSIGTPVMPHLARLVEAGDMGRVWALYRRCIAHISVATLAVAALLVTVWPVWAGAMDRLLGMDATLAWQLWLACLLLLGYLHVAASGTVAVAAFCAMGEAQTPVKVGVPAFLFFVVVKSLAFLAWGLPGLAAATSLYYITNMALLSLILKRRIDAHTAIKRS
jgi:putative peptidoglycan lipid II flippase